MFFEKPVLGLADAFPPEARPDFTELLQYFQTLFQTEVITEWKGHEFIPPFDARQAKWQNENWTPNSGDVLVATFPKTGTSWMREIVRHLYYQDDEEKMRISEKIHVLYSYLEIGIPKKFEIIDKLPLNRKIYGTHLPAYLINMERIKHAGAKVICTLRNPKDQLVSFYHMAMALPHFKQEFVRERFPEDWDSFFEKFLAGKQCIGPKDGEGYAEYILTWLPHRSDDNVLFVTFEDMKKNPLKEIRRIALFLGVRKNDEDLIRVANQTNFDNMKQRNDKITPGSKFFRKGEVGDWKNYFSDEQADRMDRHMNEKLQDTDIKFTYEL